MALVATEHQSGTEVMVDVRGKGLPGRIVDMPFLAS
ncbi:MAG: hypothetical protein GKR86_15330 [Ilumatobacter sp.]|nr:hypothetical protein [Ilumatobacter sp.]